MSNIKQIEFFNNIPKDKVIVIYGVGSFGEFIYNLFKDINISITCYVVSDGYADKDEFNGIPVYEISKLPYENDECAIIVSAMNAFYAEILENIKKVKYQNIHIFEFKDMSQVFRHKFQSCFVKNKIDMMEPTIKINDWEIKNLFQMDNSLSYTFFAEIGDCVIPIIAGDYSEVNEGSYEYGEVKLENGDVVFDCGANIGLVSSVAASKGCYVYAFEPLKNIAEILEQVCFKYMKSIEVCYYALCDYVGKTSFDIDSNNSSGYMSQKNTSNNAIEVNTTTIDQFVKENNITKLDFIKADIEGAERSMLKGAENTLATLAPKLAICTYHLKDDPEVLEKIIKEANPNYVVKHKWKKLFAYVPK